MGIIKADKLVFEYIRRDEEGNVEGITRAVDEVDLDVQQGDFIAVLGHNGSGKSTLAKHINAILYPTEGTVWVDGMDTKDEKDLWSGDCVFAEGLLPFHHCFLGSGQLVYLITATCFWREC